ncbi:unnamed protein product [Rotaria magnacalcarata]|nr:unnamed protein product [Rotaria magnacalcarata]CAF1617018.1 unnamed protein product [Rotaria magnacalcarata]CAF1950793.1 unnamed protein product [Rotaria magnacalcarata]CAF4118291.1 unnamed protein product [Rotaria magnacalcarata]CAF4147601.1 unnamed protein product [Rotaria magnacalcarata]
MIESNLTKNEYMSLTPVSIAPDRTGLFIALFLLFLLFILISYLFYSFLSFKRFSSRQNRNQNNATPHNPNNKVVFDDNDDLINNNGEIILGRQSSFSDCGTSLRSSSIRSNINQRAKRSSSYKYCSQTSNYLLTPCLSSQIPTTGDESQATRIIVEPNDIQLANALSRSISKYYERKRKPILKRRTHSCEDIVGQMQTSRKRSPLQLTSSLPARKSLPQSDNTSRQNQRPSSCKTRPATIYELYKSDKMRIANLFVSDT